MHYIYQITTMIYALEMIIYVTTGLFIHKFRKEKSYNICETKSTIKGKLHKLITIASETV